MHAAVRSRLQRFRRRVHLASFGAGAARSLALLLLLGAAALVTARLAGWPWPEARPAWLLLLLVPAAHGVWHAWRTALPRLTQVAHLDRCLRLDGLLLTSVETASASWQEELQQALVAAQGRMPEVRWASLAWRVALPAALFAGVCSLPEPAPILRAHPSVAQAVQDLESAIELLRQEGVVAEDKIAELQRRVDELARGQEHGNETAWSDIDELQARMQQERVLQRDALQKAAHAAKALQAAARNPGATSPGGAAPDLDAQMRELLQHAAAAGLLGKLPPDFDPSQASKAGDAEAFDELARALAQSALEQIEAHPGALGEGAEDLAELLRGMQGDGPGAGMGEDGGRGGVDRGPGHSTLESTEHFDGDTSALQAHKLPPGRVLPQDWEIMQTKRVEPEVAPVRDSGSGSAAASGAGEAAWRRRLSPSHRAVVREFFSSRRDAATDKR